MIDHKLRLTSMQQRELENAEMMDMEARSMPFYWMLLVVVAIAATSFASNVKREQEEALAQSEVLAQCLNGRAVELDGAVLRCELRDYKLVHRMEKRS